MHDNPNAPAPSALEKAPREFAQAARELALETGSFEEFAAALGLGNSCERCGREGLDAEGYSDCEFVLGGDPDDFGELVCHECLRAEQQRATMPSRPFS